MVVDKSRAQTRALLRITKREAFAFKCDEVADESEERALLVLLEGPGWRRLRCIPSACTDACEGFRSRPSTTSMRPWRTGHSEFRLPFVRNATQTLSRQVRRCMMRAPRFFGSEFLLCLTVPVAKSTSQHNKGRFVLHYSYTPDQLPDRLRHAAHLAITTCSISLPNLRFGGDMHLTTFSPFARA